MVSSPRKRRNRTEIAVRRLQFLDLRVGGASYSQIANKMQTSKSVAHGEVQKALTELADEHGEEAGKLRAIQMERYNKMILRYLPSALAGDSSSADTVLRIMESINRINGLAQQVIGLEHTFKSFTFHIEKANNDLPIVDRVQTAIPIRETEESDI